MIGIPQTLSQLRRYYSRKNADNLEARIIRPDNFQKAREFLERHFYKQDPLHVCMKLYQNEKSVSAFENYIENMIQDDMSIMMLDQRKDIIGLCMNSLFQQNERHTHIRDEGFKKITDLVDAIDRKCNLFNKFGVDRYVKLEILKVDPTTEKRGVEKKLIDITRYMAKQNQIRLMRMDCSSHYNVELALRLGFTPIYRVKYENYRMGNKPVFNPDPPHTEYSVFVYPIEEEIATVSRNRSKKQLRRK